MKVHTALLALCVTSLLAVFVMASISFLSVTGGAAYQPYLQVTSPVKFVAVDPSSPTCSQEGVRACRRENSGDNFFICADKVMLECSKPQIVRLAKCFLPAGFELKYAGRRECRYGLPKECKVRCPGSEEDCIELSRIRCDLIGRRFQ